MRTWRILGTVLALILVVSAIRMVRRTSNSRPADEQPDQQRPAQATNSHTYAAALGITQDCEGRGPVDFTHPPMQPDDVATILPYGLLAGGHVTPIDHMYFSPKDFYSAADTYPVYAIADGTIATTGFRPDNTPPGEARHSGKKGDYRLDLFYNCTFFSYYDLITSLSPELAAAVPSDTSQFWNKRVMIPVKAGQLIGRIGGQTLDWAVYNDDVVLPGLLVAEHYEREPWKIHTDYRALEYFVEPIQQQLNALLARQAEPRTGKIDYDQEGALVGNWFVEGTNGYAGAGSTMEYWGGHLAIVPDYIDPSLWHFSVGDWQGKPMQFGIASTPIPSDVTVASGVTTYELHQSELYDEDTGKTWMSNTAPIPHPKGRLIGPPQGVVLLQLIEPRRLKVELFPGATAAQVSGFTEHATIYER